MCEVTVGEPQTPPTLPDVHTLLQKPASKAGVHTPIWLLRELCNVPVGCWVTTRSTALHLCQVRARCM